jgi:hypothetical protein
MKTLKYFLLILAVYFITGTGLLYSGVLNKWPIGYKTYLKYKKDRDSSVAAADGPWVFYKNNTITAKTITSNNGRLQVQSVVLPNKKKAVLTCYVAETDDHFTFHLKDTLKTEPALFSASNQMMVLSDIEGNFKGFKQMLVSAGVVTPLLKWKYGNGHLVLVGDFFDRGLQVTECLWLIYQLEQEAEQAGGKVHFILGNHEIMNLKNDYRYVRKKYLENAELTQMAYSTWYTADTELGRWLRTKNVVEKIGNLAFSHGGISWQLAQKKLTLVQINDAVRNYLNLTNAARPAAEDEIMGREGVYWYRGLALQQVDTGKVNEIMQYLGATRLIIGHTVQPKIQSYYNGKVVAVDLPHQENSNNGFMHALLVKKGALYAISTDGERRLIK